jgi:hypothetical protein
VSVFVLVQLIYKLIEPKQSPIQRWGKRTFENTHKNYKFRESIFCFGSIIFYKLIEPKKSPIQRWGKTHRDTHKL